MDKSKKQRGRPKMMTASQITSNAEDPDCYDVEAIEEVRLHESQPSFLVKWRNYDASDNTWEPLEHVCQSLIFRQYINQKFRELENVIFVGVCNIKEKIKQKVRDTMEQPKYATMLQIESFDPFEYKVHQLVYHLTTPTEAFRECLEELVFRNYFFRLEILQRERNAEFLKQIKNKEDINIDIENEENFDDPPVFEYITKNMLTEELHVVEQSERKGCNCEECSDDSECCPSIKKTRFPYKLGSGGRILLRFTKHAKIIECGNFCSCGIHCMNRVSQQPTGIPLCLFRTMDRGWGLKTEAKIPKGKFIMEYVGELIDQDEANSREETSYFFDLNFEKRTDDRFYTIDSYKYGNLSRFTNHSCNPNCRVYHVETCYGGIRDEKLCFFADRLIPKGEELTIDYRAGEPDQFTGTVECSCGSENCRKFIF